MRPMSFIKIAVAALALSSAALAQNNSPVDGPFQVKYAANLNVSDSVFNITNTGVQTNAVTGIGDICVNTYVFASDEQLAACCTCQITRNSLWSLSANRDLISNILTPDPTIAAYGIVVKLLATQVPAAGVCDAASADPVNYPLTQGLAAWGTTTHYIQPPPVGGVFPAPTGIFFTETPFTNSSLSTPERVNMASTCGFIKANGSHYGICKSCAALPGNNIGLGGDKQ
jgi:hypothetical protein